MNKLFIYFINLRQPNKNEDFYLNNKSSIKAVTKNIL